MNTRANRVPVITTLGALVAVICAIAVTLIVGGASPVIGGIGIGLAALLLVLLGILLGLEIRAGRAR